MCLWCEDLPPASLAVLSAKDDLVPTELIISHLQKHGSTCEVRLLYVTCTCCSVTYAACMSLCVSCPCMQAWEIATCRANGLCPALPLPGSGSAVLEQVMCHPTAAHGGFLLDGKFRQHMLHAIVRTLEAGAKAT